MSNEGAAGFVPPGGGAGRRSMPPALAAVLAAVLAAGVLVMLSWAAQPARADTTFTVTDASDADGAVCASKCTLRQAINAANAAAGKDTIVFDLGPSATIQLGGQLPLITDAQGLTIDGPGATALTVDGQRQGRVFQVDEGAELVLQKLTVANGQSPTGGFGPNYEGGGAVLSFGNLTATNVAFRGNIAGQRGGGALSLFGDKSTVTNSLFDQNTASGGAPGNGAGIYNNNEGTLTVTGSTFSGNYADASGGGIYNNESTLTVTGSTFSSNYADDGGGIYNNGTLAVTNSTFSENVAEQGNGGGIDNLTVATIAFSTFSRNSAEISGGGINQMNFSDATTRVSGTILAGNLPGSGNCGGTITDAGFNIDDAYTCRFSRTTGSKPNTDPRLDPKGSQSNGGPTQTIALLSGSPAVDAIARGRIGCGTTVTSDQRGTGRPQGTGCDIGAFELQAEVGTPEPEECTIRGTRGNDVLRGTRERDVICAGGGNDVVKAGGGDDVVRGSGGNDAILGEAGDDRLYGGGGRDRLVGGPGRDVTRQ